MENIFKILKDKFNDSIEISENSDYIKVDSKDWHSIATLLKENEKLKFDYLMCISSYDKGDKKTYGVAYNFKSTSLGHYLEVRIEVDDESSIERERY